MARRKSTDASRARRHAQNQADRLAESVGLRGWIIVRPGGTWYGPYLDEEMARRCIGKLDSCDMQVTGNVVKAGK